MRVTFLIICLLLSSLHGYSQLEMSPIFSNGMVLQQNASVKIWGWGNAGDKISVCADWNISDTIKTIVDNAGRWECELRTAKSGDPYNVTIQGSSQKIILSDVLLGEVWLCSGQSNMEWSVNNGIDDGENEASNAAYNTLRIFHIPKRGASTPQVNCNAKWEISSPESMRKTSATAYFFGRYLSEKLGVPVGIIVSAWGGTPAEVWTPADVVNNNSILSKCKLEEYPWWPTKPGVLFNQMINPIMPFKLAGCIWYQGESNHQNASSYSLLMQNLIHSWRSGFENNFPFYYVQIAPHSYISTNNTPAKLREQQQMMLNEVEDCGMINISDLITNVKDIHPRNKRAIGERLAYMAMDKKYGKYTSPYESPYLADVQANSKEIMLNFDGNFNMLSSTKKEIEGLVIVGADGKESQVNATIKGKSIIVKTSHIMAPYQLFYCFDDATIGSLRTEAGLPVLPFRTKKIYLK